MKKITHLLVVVLASITLNAQVQNYNVGDVVDDFTLTDTAGNIHNLYSITAEGKYVFLDFFFDTCPPCQTTTPIFNEFYDKYGCNEGIIYCLSVNNGSDTDPEVILFEQTHGGPFNHAPAVSADGGAGAVDANFGITAYPTYCLINPNNEIIVLDIWPIAGVQTFENALPTGVDPEPMECTPLNIQSAIFMDAMKLYPNPARSNSSITIELRENVPSEIAIYTLLGQEVYSNSFESNKIQIATEMATGTYIVKVSTSYGVANHTLLVN